MFKFAVLALAVALTSAQVPDFDFGNGIFLDVVKKTLIDGNQCVKDQLPGFDPETVDPQSVTPEDFQHGVKVISECNKETLQHIADEVHAKPEEVVASIVGAFEAIFEHGCHLGQEIIKAGCQGPQDFECVKAAVEAAPQCKPGLAAFVHVAHFVSQHHEQFEAPIQRQDEGEEFDPVNGGFFHIIRHVFNGPNGCVDKAHENQEQFKSVKEGVEAVHACNPQPFKMIAQEVKATEEQVVDELAGAIESIVFGECRLGEFVMKAQCEERDIACLRDAIVQGVQQQGPCSKGAHAFIFAAHFGADHPEIFDAPESQELADEEELEFAHPATEAARQARHHTTTTA